MDIKAAVAAVGLLACGGAEPAMDAIYARRIIGPSVQNFVRHYTVTCPGISGPHVQFGVGHYLDGTDLNEPDTNYKISATPVSYTGSPPDGAFQLMLVLKGTTAITLQVFMGPGVGSTVTWDVVFTRAS
jgi:hypothetical protein